MKRGVIITLILAIFITSLVSAQPLAQTKPLAQPAVATESDIKICEINGYTSEKGNLEQCPIFNPQVKTAKGPFGWLAKLMGFKEPFQKEAEKSVNEQLKKLAPSINKYSKELGVDPRIVGGVIYVEDFRSLTTPKGFIEGKLEGRWITRMLLEMKGATIGVGQMSREEMWRIIKNFNDANSKFYMGKNFENYVTEKDFENSEKGIEYVKNGIHGYVFTDPDVQVKFVASMIAQFQAQWKNEGYDISDKPEILGTLYNIGFKNSNPKKDPQSGGSMNFIFGKQMNFGDATKAWHDSNLNPEIGKAILVAKQ